MVARKSTPSAHTPDPLVAYYLIPESWAMTAPAMAICYLLVVLSHWAMPVVQSSVMVVSAVALALAAPAFARWERIFGRQAARRYALMAVAVALPMLLFGASLATWYVSVSSSDTALLVATLAVVGMVASITLGSRLPSLLCAQAMLWAGFAVESAASGARWALLTGLTVGAAAAYRQMNNERAAVAEQFAMRRAQLRAEEILADYEQTGQGWFWETDRKGAITYVSTSISQQLGREPASLYGRPFVELFLFDERGLEGEHTLSFHLTARSSFQDMQLRAATEGEERYWSVNGRPVYDEFNNFLGFRGSGSDLTEKRRSEQNASRLAHYDSLTGLANRLQMSQTLEKILSAPQASHRTCAVFLLDLDRFKQVNDTMGHPAGDALLKQVAQRLQRTVGEAGRVGRLGGDEFQVILPGRISPENLATLASRIIGRLSEPYIIESSRVVIGASIGIALAPDDGVTSEAIIRNADLALYAAKDRGRGVHHFYAPDLHSDAEERHQLEHDLRDALATGGLELYYQPVVQVPSERITGFEALLRWNHPVKGQLSPSKFIPIAEDAGLIAPIGEWALRTACHDLAKWPEEVRVAVNVSPLQFANPALPAIVTSALANAQVHPSRLELELTESVFLNNDEGTDAMFAALKRIGVRLALDDFGTGYSSLGYLKNAPFDKIKIDQSFVHGATLGSSRNGAIIASIVSLAEALGMETTAEGVELLDELELMRELGCSHIQGYIYSRPIDATAVGLLLTGDLVMEAKGPRSARATRRTMLRKVVIEHEGTRYDVTIRNLSDNGVMLEGLWNVPLGLELEVALGHGLKVTGSVRWSQRGRIGLQFARRLAPEEIAMVTGSRLPSQERLPEKADLRKMV